MVPVPGTVPDPNIRYLAPISNNRFVQNLAFSMSEAALFTRKVALNFDSLTFSLRTYVKSGSKSGFGTGTVMHSGSAKAKVAIPAVLVPVPQH